MYGFFSFGPAGPAPPGAPAWRAWRAPRWGSSSTVQKEASILYNRYLAESTPSAAPETPPLSPLLPSLPRLDRDALITLAAAFFLLTDGDRGTDWESVILAGILLFLGF